MSPFFAVLAAVLAMSKPGKTEAPPMSGGNEQVQVLAVRPTPESTTVVLKIAIPGQGQVLNGNPVWVQFRLNGFALGAGSKFERADELVNSKMGQTVHAIIDDYPYIAINEPAVDPFDESGYFYVTSYKFEVPFKLKEGMHTIRMFPARSFGESLKGENTFASTFFYVGEKEESSEFSLSGPYLTYNEPSDQMKLVSEKPVLLDFYLTNCELTPDGYKVQLTIDGKIKRALASWQPYYIYGLEKGKHTIRLQLLDSRGEQVPGAFNDVQRTIHIY